MKRKFLLIASIVSFLFLGACSSPKENGSLTVVDGIKVVDLYGTWEEMGQQYGKLLKNELNDVYDFCQKIITSNDSNSELARNFIERNDRQQPYSIDVFFNGAASTSGLTKEELLCAQAVEMIAGLPACSAIAVNDEYTNDHKLIFGRNYDYGKIFRDLADDLVVTIFHPSDGGLATAIVGYVGEIYAVNAINEKGVFLELNNGKPSNNKTDYQRTLSYVSLFMSLFENDTLADYDRFFKSTKTHASVIINVADKEEAFSCEWTIDDAKIGDSTFDDDLLISTNHFVNEEWGTPLPEDENSWQSITRRQNLNDLCGKYKGDITPQTMMDILDTRLEDGGATDDLTIYQLVVVPEDMIIYIKVKPSDKWAKLELNKWMN